ncbi:MAG: signal peptide peptidase SppA, partial [Candidatus Pacearchaeota archaeon]
MKKENHLRCKLLLWIIIFIAAFSLIIVFSKSFQPATATKNVALIHIDGTILTSPVESFLPYSATYSEDIIKFIEDAMKNKNIKAIIFEINSPGGSAVASSEIAEAIKKAKEEKLTVALIREQGTSGAYWIASSCDYIVAHPLSVTGSIGVLASYLEISGLLERFNITYVNLTAGKHKDIMSPYRELTEEEREMIQNKIDLIHEAFIDEVVKNRKLNDNQAKE